MLVSKIKPCRSKYMLLNMVRLRTAHYIGHGFLDLRVPTWITLVILELIHAQVAPTSRKERFY